MIPHPRLQALVSLLACCVFASTPVLAQTVRYVDDSATGPIHDGASWCSAYLYLQDALAVAQNGDTIRGAQGTYKPDQGAGQTSGDRSASFHLISGIILEGGYAGCGEPDPDERDFITYETILSGDLNDDDDPIPSGNCCIANGTPNCGDDTCETEICFRRESCCTEEWDEICAILALNFCCDICGSSCDNSYHVVTADGVDETAVLDGFTITAGTTNGFDGGGMYIYADSSPTLANCTFTKNRAERSGGGIYNDGGNPTLVNCAFIENAVIGTWTIGAGGGMYNEAGSDVTLDNCTFNGNFAIAGGVSQGGAMYNGSPSDTVVTHSTLIGCTFIENYVAGGVSNYGGGVQNERGTASLTNCSFIGNYATRGVASRGGGVRNARNTASFTNCSFIGNWADTEGGAALNSRNTATFINCMFSGNSAGRTGGGMSNTFDGVITLTNCSFGGNIAQNYGGGIRSDFGAVTTLANCIFWDNMAGLAGDQILSDDGVDVSYSCVQGGWSGIGNIASDPLFADEDLRLSPDSPCIDAADNTSVPADLPDLDDDGDTNEPIPFDLDGNPRFVDNPRTSDTGYGTPPIVDMGSYEHQPESADCNGNGVPDEEDIAEGTSDDINGNGIPDECEIAPPVPEDSLGITTCTLDTNCENEAFCVPGATGSFQGTCYVPKNRYLSVAPNTTNVTATGRRLSVVTFERSCGGAGNSSCINDAECAGDPDGTTCDDVRTGSQVIGWFGQPDGDGFAGVVDETNRHYAVWADLSFPIECGVDELCPAGSHCDTGLGASNTCRFDVGGAEVPSTVVHLSGCHIAPKRRDVRPAVDENTAANFYMIEAIAEGSDIADGSNYSTPLELRTVSVWGDMTGGTENNVALPPNNETGFLNILHQVNRFKDKGKATTTWLDLDPQEPDRGVGFLDMLQGVNGFKDQPYPFDDPCTCAGLPPCE